MADHPPNNKSTIPALWTMPFKALGGSPPFAPQDLERFVSSNRIAMFSYIRSDGRPNQAPLWYLVNGGVFTFIIDEGSAKHVALQRDNRVCVAIQDERPPYRAVIIDGTVELIDVGKTSPLSEEMAVRYFGKVGADAYAKLAAETRRTTSQVVLRLVPNEVKGFDNTTAIAAPLLGFIRLRHRLPIPKRWL